MRSGESIPANIAKLISCSIEMKTYLISVKTELEL